MNSTRCNFFESMFYALLKEDVDLESSGHKGVLIQDVDTMKKEHVDISNFIYSNTNAGTEPVTLVGVRKNNSRTDPSKKAGDEMKINGRISFKYTPTGTPSPLGDRKQRYDKYDIITLMVTSVDGKRYPKAQIRNIKANTINKINMGRKTYNILN